MGKGPGLAGFLFASLQSSHEDRHQIELGDAYQEL